MIGEKVKEKRKELRMTQEELGKVLNVKKSQVSYIENNKSDPTLEGFCTLCKLFNVSVDWLLFDKEDESLRDDEKEMLKIYNGLNDKNKQRLIGRAESILEEQEENDSTIETAIS